jgi:hypothetical protein
MHEEARKAALRLRELSADPVASAYLVGHLLADTPPNEYASLVQAALVYRERFGASGNDSRKACVQAVDHTRRCDRCAQEIVETVLINIARLL